MIRIKIISLWALGWIMITGCERPREPTANDLALSIFPDTVVFPQPDLILDNGVYHFRGKPYSGIVYRLLKGFEAATYSPVLNGKLDGTYRSFYPSGKPYEIRDYRNGLAFGKHIGYWDEGGKLKFEYHYENQKQQGSQKTWYPNGNPAYAYNYTDDQLDGLQQAWRENGSLYRNFTVKNGINYGLQRSKTCYEVSNEEVILQANKNN